MTGVRTDIAVTVRYFAAASAAAGMEQQTLTLPSDSTVADLLDILCERHSELARILPRCSYLRDGVAVRDRASGLMSGQTVDVLPPFAGG